MSYRDYFIEVDNNTTLEEKIKIIKQKNIRALNLRKEIGAWGGGLYK